MRRLVVIPSAFSALVLFAATALATSPQNLSGYETSAGVPCTIGGQAGRCGVTFQGWTGGAGQVAGGWVAFPGDRQGAWRARVNFTGTAGSGQTVTITRGSWKLVYGNGPTISGAVASGTVTWPAAGTSSIACGLDATVSATGTNPNQTFTGCLNDKTVFPPRIWGTFTYS